jgi:hypothetical protein
MSALGHYRTSTGDPALTALHSIADIDDARPDVCFVPIGEIVSDSGCCWLSASCKGEEDLSREQSSLEDTKS